MTRTHPMPGSTGVYVPQTGGGRLSETARPCAFGESAPTVTLKQTRRSWRAFRADERGQAMTESAVLMMMEVGVVLYLLSLENPLYAAVREHYDWFNVLAMWPIP